MTKSNDELFDAIVKVEGKVGDVRTDTRQFGERLDNHIKEDDKLANNFKWLVTVIIPVITSAIVLVGTWLMKKS